jgi:hypothetical protein
MASLSQGRMLLPAGRTVGMGLLFLFLFARFRDAFGLPFLNDDYVFLDHVQGKRFADLWGFGHLAFHWWRPWSREFHYWWLSAAFGPVEWPFHAASFALTAGVLAAYWALARRLAGAPAAAVAVAGVVTLPGWGLLLLWSAGAQDLWMLLFSLVALLAWQLDRPGFATIGYALALASKETAAPLPLLFLVHDVWVGRKAWTESLVRLAPSIVVGFAWAFAHPLVLGRLWAGAPAALPASPAAVTPAVAAWKSALSVFSLDVIPAPDGGWRAVWWDAARSALLVFAFLELLARPDARPSNILGGTPGARRRGVLPLAFAWWVVGTLPLLLPGLGWHAYYAHFAALGAWLGIGRLLARRSGFAIALMIALAILGAGRAATPSEDWGEAAYQRRAGKFVSEIKQNLLAVHPTLAPHSRLWFVRLPNNVGFLAGDGPAVRVWYRDPTLKGGYYSAYAPRAAGEPEGSDHFFRMDEAGSFLEIRRDMASDTASVAAVASADSVERQANPRWRTDRLSLASALAGGRDWRGAAAEFRRLAIAYPESSGFAFDAASAFMQAGDSAAAFQWFREAARRPGAPPELIEAVRGIVPATVLKPKPKRPRAAGTRTRQSSGGRRR